MLKCILKGITIRSIWKAYTGNYGIVGNEKQDVSVMFP